MENQNQFQPTPGFNAQMPLPNATAVLVLGIIGIVSCFCYGLPGIICSVIALILASKDMKLYKTDPSAWTPGSVSNLKSGRVCAIIALSLSILCTLIIIIAIATVGFAALTDPNAFQHFAH